MSASTRTIDVLLKEVTDPALRGRLAEAVKALRKRTRFGLVFEGHHPEVSRLPDVPVRKGGLVARRSEKGSALYRVTSVSGTSAICAPEEPPVSEAMAGDDLFAHALTVPLSDLVAARRFGEAIYPSMKIVESIRCGDGKAWHQLIQADNYHALQALGYTHAGKVDVIYLDPPYNTGARDWRYNNDYVDLNDPFRHSKWLSFMEKRLQLAKKLLKPDGVMIITIDEHEVHHLGCLLEQVFKNVRMQMVSICINPSGASGDGLSRVEEYAYFLFFGDAQPAKVLDDGLSSLTRTAKPTGWESLLRRGNTWYRQKRKNLCYPVLIDKATNKIAGVGDPFDGEDETSRPTQINGKFAAWPVRKDLKLGIWRVEAKTLMSLASRGYAFATNYDEKRDTWSLRYLMSGAVKAIENGKLSVIGKGKYGEAQIEFARNRTVPKTMWLRGKHTAGGSGGTQLLAAILGDRGSFSYPKSVYAVMDCIRTAIGDRSDALILDFFGGSGTTLNAVCLLNATDGGNRQCIVVTNNEVSEDDRKRLLREGKREGDPAWEAFGICRAVTWPRCKNAIRGKRDDQSTIPGKYGTGNYETKEVSRAVVQLGFAEGKSLDLTGRKDVARLIDGVSLGTISATSPWHLNVDDKTTILWDISQRDEWLEAVADTLQIEAIYVVTKQKTEFTKLAKEINELLAPLMIEQEITRPMVAGFEENLAYLELGFLDPSEVARGQQFAAVLPLLWMLTGAKGECPKPGSIRKWLIAPECGFAVLHDDSRFIDFQIELEDREEITHIFLVTNSDDTFKEMRTSFRKGIRTYKLYSSYLLNFGINVRPAS